jgi:phosphoglycolate phosphatase-like HAD superfamily hydrolase
MSLPDYPTELTQPHWDKKKGLLAKTKATGIGEQLKALLKLHQGLDGSAYSQEGLTTLSELETREKALQSDVSKKLKPVLAQLKEVEKLAKLWAKNFTEDKLIPKSAAQAATQVAKAAASHTEALNQAVTDAELALSKLRTSLENLDTGSDDEEEDKNEVAAQRRTKQFMKLLMAQKDAVPALGVTIAMAGKDLRLLMAKRSSPTHRNLLKTWMGDASGIKYHTGTCLWEASRHTFVLDPVPAGIVKKLQAALLDVTGVRYKIRVRGADPSTAEEADDQEERPPTTVTKEESPPSVTPPSETAQKVVTKIQQSLKALGPKITELVKGGDPNAPQVRQMVVALSKLGPDDDLQAAATLLKKLEQMVTAPPTPPQPDPQTLARQRADLLKTQIDEIFNQADTVIGNFKDGPLKQRITTTGTGPKGEFKTAHEMLDQVAREQALLLAKPKAETFKSEADIYKQWDDYIKDTFDPWLHAVMPWVNAIKCQSAKNVLTQAHTLQSNKRKTLVSSGQLADLQGLLTEVKALYDLAKKINDEQARLSKVMQQLSVSVNSLGNAVTPQITQALLQLRADRNLWPAGTTQSAISLSVTSFFARIDQLKEEVENARGGSVGKTPQTSERKKQEIEALFVKIADAIKTLTDPVQKQQREQALAALKLELGRAVADTQAVQRGRKLVSVDKKAHGELQAIQKAVFKQRASDLETRKKLDEEIVALSSKPDDPLTITLCKAALEARFDITLEMPDDLKTKALPRLYEMMCKVPDWHTVQAGGGKQSLKVLEFKTAPTDEGNYFQGESARIALQDMPEDGQQIPYVPDEGSVENPVYFDVTTLHEVGHAVDDKISFMTRNMTKSEFGAWTKHDSLDAVVDALGNTGFYAAFTGTGKTATLPDLKQALTAFVSKGTCARPANATGALGSLFAQWDAIVQHELIVKCIKGMHVDAEPWNGGKAHAQAIAVGGRVYQESYANTWHSYDLSARTSTGVSAYQWRAPGEWFAEIYALYYLGKLKETHPMHAWFKDKAGSEDTAMA